MKFPANLIGRRIVAVEQERMRTRDMTTAREWSVNVLVLDDGTRVSLFAQETDAMPIVTVGDIVRPPRARSKRSKIDG